MREILFRGKRKDNGEWVEGYFSKRISALTEYTTIDRKEVKAVYNQGTEYMYTRYSVIPETVGQYTGLLDKNGTKIFEGDIVKCSDVDDCYYTEEKTEFFGVIKFEAGAFGVATKETLRIALDDWCENDNFVSLWELEWNEYIGNVEVIGSIHDNPELLKEREGKCCHE